MATMGIPPVGTPGAIVRDRSWDDYSLGRASCEEHLAALDIVYDGVIADHRKAMDLVGEIDRVTEDMLIGQTAALEQFQWFIRAHLETNDGELETAGATTEKQAADQVTHATDSTSGKTR
jgi:starvation-inducible DNA-binding protein